MPRGRFHSALLRCVTIATIFLVLANRSGAATKYKVLHNFGSWTDGALPSGPLLLDKKGNLYGGTYNGGTGCSSSGCGLVFELKPGANGRWSENVLHDFTGGSDGATP